MPRKRCWRSVASAPTPTRYRAMLACAKHWPNRVWAIEGCQGIGKHIAMRLLADGEDVVDVPPKLSARARVFAAGQGRKTDATDAHSVALVGTRVTGLRPVVDDQQLAVLRILVDRRRSLGEDHTRMVSQLHQLLLELVPGGAKKDLSAAQAKAGSTTAPAPPAWPGSSPTASTAARSATVRSTAARARRSVPRSPTPPSSRSSAPTTASPTSSSLPSPPSPT